MLKLPLTTAFLTTFILSCFSSNTFAKPNDKSNRKNPNNRAAITHKPASATSNKTLGSGDFAFLVDHWNFDDGRDWHNQTLDPKRQPKNIKNYGCDNALIIENKKNSAKIEWVSGREFAGLHFDGKRNQQLVYGYQPFHSLTESASLSYWLKVAPQEAKKNGALIGTKEMEWGVITANGRLGIRQNGHFVAMTPSSINDGEWHHIVLVRQATTGAVGIFVDGKFVAKGSGIKGDFKEEFNCIGGVKRGSLFVGSIDQIHIFNKVISKTTVATLLDNHSPKLYSQETLITKGKPSLTGSVFHLYTFDPDQDKLTVCDYSQGKYGAVKYNRDGTFTYLSKDEKFNGRDRFEVVITDGKGGFSKTDMQVKDSSTIAKVPIKQYTNFQTFPTLEAQQEKTSYRIPIAYDWDKNNYPDLLVCAHHRLWGYPNTGKQGKFPFMQAPSMIENIQGEPIEATAIAILDLKQEERPDLVIRAKDGSLNIYHYALLKDGRPVFKKGKGITNDQDQAFKCTSNKIAFIDYDYDGHIDLLSGEGGGIYLYKNLADKGFILSTSKEKVIGGDYNLTPYFGDLNQDGRPDLLHGINWGTIHYWINQGHGRTIIDKTSRQDLTLTNAQKQAPTKSKDSKESMLRYMNGTFGTFADFDHDSILDFVVGGDNGDILAFATGIDPNDAKQNLTKIEAIYNRYGKNLGKALENNNQELLKKYKELNHEWITWAVNLPTVQEREFAYNQFKRHIAKYSFLKRGTLDAWIKHDKDKKVTEVGPMHHVPGIFTMNWVVLHNLKPDSAAHRLDVAKTLNLQGLTRTLYLKTGLVIGDNAKCSEGQLRSIIDFFTYHPRVLFPDDFISFDLHFGDGREAMNYVFRSNKNTFGCDVGGAACESAGDLKAAAEKYLGEGAATGDYFTLVMGHEVCHSLDAYVYRIANKGYAQRWNDMLYYAATNAGKNDLIAPSSKGIYDKTQTQKNFKKADLWDGKADTWNDAWKTYWDHCQYNNLSFMRGNIGWFIDTKQETLATQANHHFAGSEARLVGALDRYYRGYKANLNEVVFYLDILSAGLNKIPMYNFTTSKNPNRVHYDMDHAWLERNDQGYITKITIKNRIYEFFVDDSGRVVGIKQQPFPKIKENKEEI